MDCTLTKGTGPQHLKNSDNPPVMKLRNYSIFERNKMFNIPIEVNILFNFNLEWKLLNLNIKSFGSFLHNAIHL